MSILNLFKKKLQSKDQPVSPRRRSAAKVDSPSADQAPTPPPRPAKTTATPVNYYPQIPLRPLMTEKSVNLQDSGYVAFRVTVKTTKQQVARAVQTKYKVKPITIKSMRVSPKRRRRGQTVGSTSSWKKVYVKVDDIQKIVSGP